MRLALTYIGIRSFNDQVGRANLIAKIRAFFTFDWLRNRFAKIAARDVRKIHRDLSGAYELFLANESNGLDFSGLTEKEFAEFQLLVVRLTKLKEIYERANFFDSKEFECLLLDTLQLSYALEAEVRVHSFKPGKKNSTEELLKEALSAKSKESLQGKL
jgi:hypothetical protein